MEVAVPVRGAGCVKDRFKKWTDDEEVAVPVRGAGCVLKEAGIFQHSIRVAVPVRGAGCVPVDEEDCLVHYKSCRPREGCGLRQQNCTTQRHKVRRFS